MRVMKRNDTTFHEMISRIRSGELTRRQAAETYGIAVGVLNVWIQRSKITGLPRDNNWRSQNPDKVKELTSHLLGKALDPERQAALNDAVARVLAGEISARAAALQDPRLSARTIAMKVRQARIKEGLPVQQRTPPYIPSYDHSTPPIIP